MSACWWSIYLASFSVLLWFVAAALPIPKTAYLQMGVGGGRPSPELDAILRKLRWQSWLNAAAALSMAISISFQLAAVQCT
jgi:hypothetical protein